MDRSDFRIGEDFVLSGKHYRCTDVRSRVVVAIPLTVTVGSSLHGIEQATKTLNQNEAAAGGWFNGPPFAVQEIVLDENDIELCTKEPILNPL